MANRDEHGTDNLVLRHLRSMDLKLDRLLDDVRNVKARMTACEAGLALIHSRLNGLNTRLDRVENRLNLIERRPELADTPA